MFKSLCHLIVRTHVVLFQIIWAWFRDPLALVQSLFWGLLYHTFARLLPYWKELISIRQINQGHNGPYKYGFVQTWDALNSTWLSSFIHLNQWKLPFSLYTPFPDKIICRKAFAAWSVNGTLSRHVFFCKCNSKPTFCLLSGILERSLTIWILSCIFIRRHCNLTLRNCRPFVSGLLSDLYESVVKESKRSTWTYLTTFPLCKLGFRPRGRKVIKVKVRCMTVSASKKRAIM